MSAEVQPDGEDFPAVAISNLNKTFGIFRALNNITLKIGQSEIFGLLGPNGAGKTTTMRVISCLLRPTSGDVLVNGISVTDATKTTEIRKKIGLLTETPNVYDRLTAEQNLRFFARAYDVPESEIELRIDRVLRDFDLDRRRTDKAGTFSKGMKQKLAIARALIHRPSVLLLDEPTSALDAESAKSIRELISETAKTSGHTVILSTHNLDDASRLCDRIAILSRGEILAEGTEDEIATQIKRTSAQLGNSDEPSRVRIEVINPELIAVEKLKQNVPEIIEVKAYKNARGLERGIEISFDPSFSGIDVDRLTAKSIDAIVRLGGGVINVEQIRATLEEIYLRIVQLSRNNGQSPMTDKK